MESVRRRVVVRGWVQGVGYRDWTRRRAVLRGVCGWVRNRPDGSVEAALEGAPGDVAALIESMRLGPSGADVQGLDAQDEPFEGVQGFSIVP